MRVLALGGSGGMGRFAVRTAVEMDSIESVVVADLNAEVAETFAREVGPKAQGLGVDVTDTEALRKAMQDVDAVINTVGPFFKFGPPVLRMAIECGCHYLDICDDWEPSLDMPAPGRSFPPGGSCSTGRAWAQASGGCSGDLAVARAV